MDEKKDKELPLGLYWKDKRTTVDKVILPFQCLEVIETINESRTSREKGKNDMFYTKPTTDENSWKNKLIWGDNKYAMSALLEKFSGKIDLIYIDPPFATGANFSTTVAIGQNKTKLTKSASAIEEVAYRDTWGKGLDSFLQMLYDRFVLMKQLLNEKGSIFVHCDWRASHYIKCCLDEVFGIENFRNEIIARRINKNLQEQFDKFSSMNIYNDSVFWYSRNTNSTFNKPKKEFYRKGYWHSFKQPADRPTMRYKLLGVEITNGQWMWGETRAKEAVENYKKYEKSYQSEITIDEYCIQHPEKEFIRLSNNKMPEYYLPPKTETTCDSLWDDIVAYNYGEGTYPTEKSEKFLERIIMMASNEGELVADFFSGSGTTAIVAERLKRKWIINDLGRFAIHFSRKRLLEIEGCRPFEILNIGKYERQNWQSLNFGGKSKERTMREYLDFILKMFKAQSIPGNTYIHGKKGTKLIHVGGVEAPVTLSDIQNAIEETIKLKQKELIVLGWEWEMGLHDVVEQEASKADIKLTLLSIPREAMDEKAVEADDIQFFELAYLETDVKHSSKGYKIELKDFIISNLDLIPAEVRKIVKKWSDYIDYWSVDWDYKNDTFHNEWQSYRTKENRDLELETDFYSYPKKGIYKVMVKVIDIFGNDTTQLIEIKDK